MTMPHDPTSISDRQSKRDPDADAIARLDGAKPGPGAKVEPPAYPQVMAPITAPARVSVILECPNCGETDTVVASLFARVTKDSDGKGALALRTRAPKVEHVCGQIPLGLVEGPRSR